MRTMQACLAAALVTVTGSAAAQEADTQPEELDELVITASGHEQQLSDAPASITVIDRETLEKRQYGDITDALRNVPGVRVTGGGGGDNGRDVSMRGMPAAYTLMLVDGRRVGTRETRPNGSAGFEQNWLPPLDAIERVEVIRGPMSTLYGSDAIGGVVNVITRSVPEQWHGSVSSGQVIQGDRDSGDSHESDFYIGGPLSEDYLGLEIFGKHHTREEDEIVDGYDERTLKSVTTKLTLSPSAGHEITAEAGVTNQNRQATVGKSVPLSGCGRDGVCEDSDSTHSRTHYGFGYTGQLGAAILDTYAQREVAENRSRDMEITNTDVKTSLMLPLADHLLTLGADFTSEELYDGTSNQISDRTETEGSKHALFVEDEWMMTRSFTLTGGVRIDEDEDYGSHASPRLYGVWNLAPTWTIKGGVSSGYRAPDLRETTADWGQVSRGGDIYGNPELEPETSVNRELSVLYGRPGALSASMTVFHNTFEDKINRVQCPASICPGGPNQFGSEPTYRVNVDEAVTQGAELSLNAALTDSLDLSSTYSHTDSEQKTGENKGQPLTQLPEHEATAELTWRATSRVEPWTRVTYRGEENQPVEGPSQGSLTAPSYTLIDLGMTYRLTDSARLSGALYNVADKEIRADEYGYVEDGRRLWVSLTAEF